MRKKTPASPDTSRVSRRKMIRLTDPGMTVPLFFPLHIVAMRRGPSSPSSRIRIGCIGTEGLGRGDKKAQGEFQGRKTFDVHTRFEAEDTYAEKGELTATTGVAGAALMGEEDSLFMSHESLEAAHPLLLTRSRDHGSVKLHVSENAPEANDLLSALYRYGWTI